MSEVNTRGDMLRIYHTGPVAGAAQPSQAASLGGYCSGSDVPLYDVFVSGSLPGIRVIATTIWHGAATLTATGTDTVALVAGGIAGEGVAIAAGETKVVESADASQFVRIMRTSETALSGSMKMTILRRMGNAFGMSDAASAFALTGGATYRAIIIKNTGGTSATGVGWSPAAGLAEALSDTAFLPAGANPGSLGTTGTFTAWPRSGWCLISDDATAKEIVYYHTRTDTSLSVLATGRARLGTSATEGAVTDTLTAVPGYAYGVDPAGAQAAGAAVQAVADEHTAPTGVTFTATAGVALAATLAAGEEVCMWLWRDTPPGAVGTPAAWVAGSLLFTADGSTFAVSAGGGHRVENAALAGFVAWVGYGAAPDATTPPDATSAALPMSFAVVPPVSGTMAVHVLVRARNKYGLVSQNQLASIVTIDSDGDEVLGPVSALTGVALTPVAGENFFATATYNGYDTDAHPATLLKVFLKAGSAPDVEVDDPVKTFAISGDTIGATLGPYTAGGTTYHLALVAVREVDGEVSETATATLELPPDPETPVPLPTMYSA